MTNDSMGLSRLSAERAATSDCAERAGELAANSDVAIPEAEWRTFSKPSVAMARKVAAFEKSAGGFKLAPEQLSACRWFGEAMDVALQEEENKTPLRNRAQHACLLIGAGGTGKTTIILELMLDVFCRFFPARPGEEERYMIATFSHAQSDAISNDVYRARTCHTACSYRVASLRNKHLALKTKEQEMKQRWQPKILVIQDEISLVPAAVENMMLYRSMRARQDEGLDPASYFHPGELMGHTNFADCRWFFADLACQRDLLSWQSRRADPQNAAQSADRTPCCPGGIDDHWYSDSFEEVEAVSGCSPARNHNSHAHVHACCSFVRGSLGSAAHSQNRKLQERTNHGLVQAWSRHWNVLGEHCSQHGGTGKSRCARPGCAVILFASCWPKAFQKK